MSSEDRECSKYSFLFSNTDSWRLYSPEYRGSKAWNIFYLVWRWVWALFFLTFVILSGALPQEWYADESQRVKWFIYLTNWGYLTFTVAQLINVVVSTVGYVVGDQLGEIKWYMKLNWFFYELSSAEAILITLLFWLLLYSPDYPTTIDTYVTHGVNGLHVLLDIWITGMPIRALHFYLPLTFGLLYVIFTIIYDYAGGTNALLSPYIYSVLDWNGGTIYPPIYSVGAILVITAIHFMLFGFCKLRQFLYRRCGFSSTHPISGQEKSRYGGVELGEY